MIADLGIYRTANILIREYGSFNAEIRVAQHLDELLLAGDIERRNVWWQVLEAVKELSETGPAPSGAIH